VLAATGGLAAIKVVGVRDDRAVINDPHGSDLVPPRPVARRQVVSGDGTTINVGIYGPDDAATVVLAHGWSCSIDFWTTQLRALSADLRVVAYDQRGHGGSARPGPAGYRMEALADDLLAVLDACVPSGQKAVLAGHSMGGFALLAFAAGHHAELRRRVAGVLLASSAAADLLAEARVLPSGPPALRPARLAVSRAALASTVPTGAASPISRRIVRFMCLSPGATEAQVAFCEQIILACPRVVRGGFGAQIARLDLSSAVAKLDVPTIVLAGSADRLLPAGHSRRLAADLPELVEFLELPGVGHMTPVESPAVVTSMIRRLVDRYLTPATDRPDRPGQAVAAAHR
jgi:pimeloyl-ACP methyl ester carboxylesterase